MIALKMGNGIETGLIADLLLTPVCLAGMQEDCVKRPVAAKPLSQRVQQFGLKIVALKGWAYPEANVGGESVRLRKVGRWDLICCDTHSKWGYVNTAKAAFTTDGQNGKCEREGLIMLPLVTLEILQVLTKRELVCWPAALTPRAQIGRILHHRIVVQFNM